MFKIDIKSRFTLLIILFFQFATAYCVVSQSTLSPRHAKTATRSRSSANRIAHYKACLKMCIYFYAFIIHKKKTGRVFMHVYV